MDVLENLTQTLIDFIVSKLCSNPFTYLPRYHLGLVLQCIMCITNDENASEKNEGEQKYSFG